MKKIYFLGIIIFFLLFSAQKVEARNVRFLNCATGFNHSIALDSDGNVWTWGDSNYGVLGLGNIPGYSPPQQLFLDINGIPLPKFTQVDAGYYNSFALDANGNIWSWGSNGNYALGNKISSGYTYYPRMLALDNLGGVLPKFKKVAASANVGMAIDVSGNMWTWGSYLNYSNGDPGYASIPAPKLRPEVSNVVGFGTGRDYNFAVTATGQLYSWGGSSYYCSSPQTNVAIHSPQLVKTLAGGDLPFVKAVSSGGYSTVILDSDGNLWAWGNNTRGQLGRNHKSNTAADQQAVVQITAGKDNGTSVTLPKFVSVSCGTNYVVAVDESGFLWSWGQSSTYETGFAATADVLIPTKIQNYFYPIANMIVPNTQTSFISADAHNELNNTANNYNLAIDTSGYLWSWGSNPSNLTGVNRLIAAIQRPTITSFPPYAPTIDRVTDKNTVITGAVSDIGHPSVGPGTITVIFPGGAQVSSAINLDGTWSVPVPKDTVMSGSIQAMQTDASSNDSPVTTIAIVDLTPPGVPIINYIQNTDTTVSGFAEANSTVRITFPSGRIATTTASAAGLFSIAVNAGDLIAGDFVKATAMDSAGNTSDEATAPIEPRLLTFKTLPTNLSFGEVRLSVSTAVIKRVDTSWKIAVSDTRGTGSKWDLYASLVTPLTSKDLKYVLSDAVIFKDSEGAQHVLDSSSFLIASGATLDIKNPIKNISWLEDQGILLQVNLAKAMAQPYSATIRWTLSDAP